MDKGNEETRLVMGEYRDRYFVEEKIKKVWAVELALLEQFQAICKKYDLTYFVIGGTLLGAVRHQGFIPWDDDIDVGMLRKDYNRFLAVCEKELSYPYRLVTPQNDDCYRAHAQIRNCETTGYPKVDETIPCNKGIFIDIFPLDKVADDTLSFSLQLAIMKGLNRILMNYYYFDSKHENPSAPKKLFHTSVLFCMKLFSPRKVYGLYDRVCSMYEKRKTKNIGELSILFEDKRYHWPKAWFFETVELPFEHLTVTAPKQYDRVLRKTFGNYLQIPKNKKERALHSDMVFDPEKPFERKNMNKE